MVPTDDDEGGPGPVVIDPRFAAPPNETLGQKQRRFMRMVQALLEYIHREGYECTIGDGYRDPRVFGAVGEMKGYGHAKSAHKQRLAIDLNLFLDGKFLSATTDHEPTGRFWESIGGTWGGAFGDGNHYSLPHDGVR